MIPAPKKKHHSSKKRRLTLLGEKRKPGLPRPLFNKSGTVANVHFTTVTPGERPELNKLAKILIVTATPVETEALHACMRPLLPRSHCRMMNVGNQTYFIGRLGDYGVIRDNAGNVTQATNSPILSVITNSVVQYNAAGCVTNIQGSGPGYSKQVGLTWNSQYQVTAVSTNGAAAGSFKYDAMGRRSWAVENGTTNWFVYEGVHVIADLDSTGGLVKSYVWGPGIDNLLSMTVYGSATNTYYALKDHLGSVLALTDAAGNIVESYRYDAWGRTTVYAENGSVLSASAVGNRYCWQGREYSWKTGLYFFRARWYEPVTGRWLSNDPIGISGGLNQYVAFGNNPVMFRDPLGLFIYEGWEQIGTEGYQAGGFWGNAQGITANAVVALVDTLGGAAVRSTAMSSGNAAGEGRTGAAIGWGAASGGLVAVNAFSFGRMGQMLGGTAGRAGVMEFSHSVPARMGGPRAWYNGSMVSPLTHAMSDPYRNLAGMTAADKWPILRQLLNRLPAWAQGLAGLGARWSLENAMGLDSNSSNCK